METDKVEYIIDMDDTISIDPSLWSASTVNVNPNYNITTTNGTAIPGSNYTINTSQFNGTSGSNFYYTNNTGITGIDYTQPGLQVKGDSDFEGDVKIKGKSILTMLETIEKRLAILQPDPEKLEYFEALQKAYEHYKTLEALCQLPKKEEK